MSTYQTQSSRIARPTTRPAAIARTVVQIDRHYWPRVNALFIGLLTAVFGVFFSAVLWHVGMEEMSWRYPVSVLLSYAVMLVMLWCWSRRASWDGNLDGLNGVGGNGNSHGNGHSDCTQDLSPGGGEFGGAGASGSFDEGASNVGSFAGDALEAAAGADEGAVVLIPIAVIIALALLCGGFAYGAVSLVWQAPALLAELMIDAGTAGLLLVYVRPADRRSWLATALRKTAPTFIAFAVVFTCTGYVLEWIDPTAITIFDVLANRALS
jgi:hypothetical protein